MISNFVGGILCVGMLVGGLGGIFAYKESLEPCGGELLSEDFYDSRTGIWKHGWVKDTVWERPSRG